MKAQQSRPRMHLRQSGFSLLQMLLSVLLMASTLGLGIRFAQDIHRESLAKQQAHKLLEVQAALQHFILDLRPALLLDTPALLAGYTPYIDANRDGSDDGLTFNAAGTVLTLPAAGGAAAPVLTRVTAGLPAQWSFAWDLGADALQNSSMRWLKPGPLITLGTSAVSGSDVVIRLGVLSARAQAASRPIRGLACLAQPLVQRDGLVDVDLLKTLLHHQPRADTGLGQSLIAVSIDGRLTSATGVIDLTETSLPPVLAGAVSGQAKPGVVCVLAGDWPQMATLGVAAPAISQGSAKFNLATVPCPAPGLLQWAWTAGGSQPVSLQNCGPDLHWSPPPNVGDPCSPNDSTLIWGRNGTTLPQTLQCVASAWVQTFLIPTITEGSACTPSGSVFTQTLYVTPNGVALFCPPSPAAAVWTRWSSSLVPPGAVMPGPGSPAVSTCQEASYLYVDLTSTPRGVSYCNSATGAPTPIVF